MKKKRNSEFAAEISQAMSHAEKKYKYVETKVESENLERFKQSIGYQFFRFVFLLFLIIYPILYISTSSEVHQRNAAQNACYDRVRECNGGKSTISGIMGCGIPVRQSIKQMTAFENEYCHSNQELVIHWWNYEYEMYWVVLFVLYLIIKNRKKIKYYFS